MNYFTILLAMLLIPGIYTLGVLWCRPEFKKEENQKRWPFQSISEWLMVLAAELSILRLWFSLERCSFNNMEFQLCFLVLAAMTILCMTDYWENIVPNKILLVVLLITLIIWGVQGIQDGEVFRHYITEIVLGFLFCLIVFGMVYLFSKGSIGAGDVKLALVMGLALGGEYVVRTIFYGSLAAAIFSVVQLSRKKVTRKDVIPFVPFLFCGLLIRYLAG